MDISGSSLECQRKKRPEGIVKRPSTLLLPILLAVIGGAQAFGAQPPVVDILYPPGGALLDRLCKNDFKLPIDDKALQAAVQCRWPLGVSRQRINGYRYFAKRVSTFALSFLCMEQNEPVPIRRRAWKSSDTTFKLFRFVNETIG